MEDIWRKISTVLDRKNNKFAFWAEASLWSTLVSCQLSENDLEPEKLSIISQQDSGSLTVNVQLFLTEPSISSPSKCSTSVACSFLRQGLNQILSGFPSPFCIANFFFCCEKYFWLAPNIFIFTGTWLSFWIRNIGGYFISLLASDTGERSLWL